MARNDIGLDGIEFVEFSSPRPKDLVRVFTEFGFAKVMRHKHRDIDLYKQGDIHILINNEVGTFADQFRKTHGPCISAMGLRFKDPKTAHQLALQRGARSLTQGDYAGQDGRPVPSIAGIGDNLNYFIDTKERARFYETAGFVAVAGATTPKGLGFIAIDHLTNNVPKGELKQWADFYKQIFEFEEIRYFDIRGVKTGLVSFAMKSPCGKFCIPINEGTEKKSQINEYLDEYKGPGIQHIAFLTGDILNTVSTLRNTSIKTLEIDDEYYQEVFHRVPNVKEDHKKIRDLNILVDGDEEGYLLQIFTKNVVGPIFIEIIERHNHHSFGEGNFGALFRSIEKDQEKRGFL